LPTYDLVFLNEGVLEDEAALGLMLAVIEGYSDQNTHSDSEATLLMMVNLPADAAFTICFSTDALILALID
jgi:hypothetical protein